MFSTDLNTAMPAGYGHIRYTASPTALLKLRGDRHLFSDEFTRGLIGLLLLGAGKAWLLLELRNRNDDPAQSLTGSIVELVSESPTRAVLVLSLLLGGVSIFGSAVIDAV